MIRNLWRGLTVKAQEKPFTSDVLGFLGTAGYPGLLLLVSALRDVPPDSLAVLLFISWPFTFALGSVVFVLGRLSDRHLSWVCAWAIILTTLIVTPNVGHFYFFILYYDIFGPVSFYPGFLLPSLPFLTILFLGPDRIELNRPTSRLGQVLIMLPSI